MRQPAISIVTACFNSSAFIHRTHASVEAQDWDDFEWIVVDDASTDDTLDRLRSIQRESARRIVIVEQASNSGAVRAIRRGIDAARGEFTLILDHDDELKANALSTLMKLWSEYGGDRSLLFGVGGRCEDETGRFIGSPFSHSPIVTNELELRHRLKVKGELAGMVRTELLREFYLTGDENIVNGQCWRRAARRYSVLHSNEVIRVYHTDVKTSMVNDLVVRQPRRCAESIVSDLNENADYFRHDPVYFLKGLTHFILYSRLAGLAFARTRKMLTSTTLRSAWFAALPLAFARAKVWGKRRMRTESGTPISARLLLARSAKSG